MAPLGQARDVGIRGIMGAATAGPQLDESLVQFVRVYCETCREHTPRRGI